MFVVNSGNSVVVWGQLSHTSLLGTGYDYQKRWLYHLQIFKSESHPDLITWQFYREPMGLATRRIWESPCHSSHLCVLKENKLLLQPINNYVCDITRFLVLKLHSYIQTANIYWAPATCRQCIRNWRYIVAKLTLCSAVCVSKLFGKSSITWVVVVATCRS